MSKITLKGTPSLHVISYAKGKRNPLKDSRDLVRIKKNGKCVKVSTDEHADIGIGLIIIPLNE